MALNINLHMIQFILLSHVIMQKLRNYFPAWGIFFYHLLITLAICTSLLGQVIWSVDELKVHHSSRKINEFRAWLVSRRVVSMTSEHHQHVVVYSCYFPCIGSAQQPCISSPSWLVMVAPTWVLVSHPWYFILVVFGPHLFSVLFTRMLNSFITKCSPVCLPQMKGVFQFFSTWTA